jgi:Ser/Thr protein kinase RdoA (MazF antagonist)
LEGCSIDDAALVIEELAPFHARWWGERAPTNAFHRAGVDPKERQERYDGQVDRFLERHGDRVPGAVRHIVRRLRSRLGAVAEAMYERPQTLIHGDLHLDNVIFDPRNDGRSVAVLEKSLQIAIYILDGLERMAYR